MYNTQYKCQCIKVNSVKKVEYLDIEMCSNIKWKEQIFWVTNKIRKMIYTLIELRDISNDKDLRLIYLASIEAIKN